MEVDRLFPKDPRPECNKSYVVMKGKNDSKENAVTYKENNVLHLEKEQ